jgi:hypothetical protein
MLLHDVAMARVACAYYGEVPAARGCSSGSRCPHSTRRPSAVQRIAEVTAYIAVEMMYDAVRMQASAHGDQPQGRNIDTS